MHTHLSALKNSLKHCLEKKHKFKIAAERMIVCSNVLRVKIYLVDTTFSRHSIFIILSFEIT